MIDPNEITAARHALGQLLATYRKAAGLNQHQLAPTPATRGGYVP